MANYIYKPATELAKLIREGKASSKEIVKEHLARVKQYNDKLNALVYLFEEESLKIAEKCDQEADQGIFRGPLHGIPMTIKEQYWMKGTKSTLNFKMLKDWTAPEDAEIVARLKHAGAIIIGKTNVCKNLTDYQVNGDIYPEGKNPYNPDYSPGGSSGGSSAAIASGMIPVELGGDFGGSIRIPSNYCGIYGLKPTENTIPGHGSAPRTKNERGFVFHMATAGPLARTIPDIELIWKIIRGPYDGDKNVPDIAWKNPANKKLKDYKIGWVDGWENYPASEYIKSEIQNFVKLLESKGCQVKKSDPGNNLHERSLSVFIRLFSRLVSQDVPWFIKPFMKMDFRNKLMKGVDKFKKEFNSGFGDSFIWYSESMGLRAEIISEWEKYFQKHDLLVCPMSFGPAFKRCKIGTPLKYEEKEMIYIDYAWPYVACFNASGNPSINIPLGVGKDGLPIGVQVVGPYWSEPDLLHFAQLVSEFTSGFVKPEGYG